MSIKFLLLHLSMSFGSAKLSRRRSKRSLVTLLMSDLFINKRLFKQLENLNQITINGPTVALFKRKEAISGFCRGVFEDSSQTFIAILSKGKFFNPPNRQASGANFAMTYCDAKAYSYRLYRRGNSSRHGYIKGGHFSFLEYYMCVIFKDCDVVVQMITRRLPGPTTHGANGQHLKPKEYKITQFGNLEEEECVESHSSKVENYVMRSKVNVK
ncbi:hypothetical protein DFH28DRAFT_1080012 [Melampsora americana]|nr:hypothetical protein DFH28DRAFT_1080012 [Melampsora americana]